MRFKPLKNGQEDLEDYDEMRSRAMVYNPEEGDLDARAPAVEEPEAYNPEEGDLDARAPTPPPEINPEDVPKPPPKELPTPALQYKPEDYPTQKSVSAVTKAVQPKKSKQDYGPKPPSRIGTLIGQGVQAAAQAYGAATMKGSQNELDAVNQRGQRVREIGAADEAARTKYSNRKNWMKDRAATRERAAAKETRLQRREDRADARADKVEARVDAKHDPNSRENALFRQAMEQEYPEQWAKIPPEQRGMITQQDAAALGIITKKADNAAETAAEEGKHQRRRGEHIEDYEKQRILDKKYRRPPTVFAFGGGGASEESEQSAEDILNEIFGSPEKVDPAVRARMRLARSLKNPKARAAAVDKVLASAQSESHKDEAAETKKEAADLKEQIQYDKDVAPARQALDAVEDFRATSGMKPGDKPGDIAGVGTVENYVPNWMYAAGEAMGNERSSQALRNRARLRNVVAERIFALSGKAATDQERRYLMEMHGAVGSMGEQQLSDALNYLENMSKRVEKDASRHYPNAARSFNETGSNPPGPDPAQGKSGTIKVRDPKNPQDVRERPDSPALRKFISEGKLELVQ